MDDLVAAMLLMVAARATGALLNLVGATVTTVGELAELITELSGLSLRGRARCRRIGPSATSCSTGSRARVHRGNETLDLRRRTPSPDRVAARPLIHVVFDIDGTVVDHGRRMYSLYVEYGDRAARCRRSTRQPISCASGAEPRSAPSRPETFPRPRSTSTSRWKRAHIEAPEALAQDTLDRRNARGARRPRHEALRSLRWERRAISLLARRRARAGLGVGLVLRRVRGRRTGRRS